MPFRCKDDTPGNPISLFKKHGHFCKKFCFCSTPRGGEEGQPQQFLVRATFSSIFLAEPPHHVGIFKPMGMMSNFT